MSGPNALTTLRTGGDRILNRTFNLIFNRIPD